MRIVLNPSLALFLCALVLIEALPHDTANLDFERRALLRPIGVNGPDPAPPVHPAPVVPKPPPVTVVHTTTTTPPHPPGPTVPTPSFHKSSVYPTSEMAIVFNGDPTLTSLLAAPDPTGISGGDGGSGTTPHCLPVEADPDEGKVCDDDD